MWKVLDKYPSYEVSDKGNVRRVLKSGKTKRLHLYVNERKRLCVSLRDRDGDRKTVPVHRLVALAFVERKDRRRNIIRHIDGDFRNNRATNLRWGTQYDNMRDKARHNRQITELEDDTVREIRWAYEDGTETIRSLATKHGLSYKMIYDIVKYRLYDDVAPF